MTLKYITVDLSHNPIFDNHQDITIKHNTITEKSKGVNI